MGIDEARSALTDNLVPGASRSHLDLKETNGFHVPQLGFRTQTLFLPQLVINITMKFHKSHAHGTQTHEDKIPYT